MNEQYLREDERDWIAVVCEGNCDCDGIGANCSTAKAFASRLCEARARIEQLELALERAEIRLEGAYLPYSAQEARKVRLGIGMGGTSEG